MTGQVQSILVPETQSCDFGSKDQNENFILHVAKDDIFFLQKFNLLKDQVI